MTPNSQQSVIFLSAEYPPDRGGVGDYTRELARALRSAQWDVAVLSHQTPPLPAGEPPQLAPPIRSWGWRCLPQVAALLRAHRPAVLHVQYQTGAFGQHPAICFLPRWLKLWLPHPPRVVVTMHDLLVPYLFPKAGPLRDGVTYRLLADADAVVVTNADDARRLRAGGHRLPAPPDLPIYRGRVLPARLPLYHIPISSNIAVAPPAGYTRAAWRQNLGVAPDTTLVAYFGLVSPTKGLETLVQALEQLPDMRLLVVGGEAATPQDQAYAAQVQARIAAAGLGARVIVTGHCSAAEVSGHLLAADLAALPFTDGASFRRGSLLAVLTHGLPTVTTRLRAPPTPAAELPDQLADGQQALMIPPHDPLALATALRRLSADHALQERLTAGARALVRGMNWESIVNAHVDLYRLL